MLLDTELPATDPTRRFSGLSHPGLIRAAIVAAFGVLVASAFVRNVNWDEFYFLSLVHDHLNGRLDRPMQTFHVHFFGWLAALPGDEMTQITAARLVMTVLLGVTAASIWRIARALAPSEETRSTGAGIAALAFLSSGYVLAHGASFRADPIAAALLMCALAILMTGRMSILQIAAVALLGALALLVTIKSVLYFPALIGAFVWRSDDRRLMLRFLFAVFATGALAGGLYLWHATGVQAAEGKDTVSNANNALKTTLLDAGIAPRLREAVLWFLLSLAPLALAFIGVAQTRETRLRVTLLLFALPMVLSVLFYRNAFAYFYPFIIPPLMVAVAIGVARITPASRLRLFVALMLLTGTWQAQKALSEGAALQRETIAEVHRLFPEPVPYIDQNAMIASFPREVFFMSSWGIQRYRAQGRPVMADIIQRTAPPLLLTSRWKLHRVMTDPAATNDPRLLLPEDARTLRETYVRYSGPIWLAGRQMTLSTEPMTLRLPMPGTYRLESLAPVMLDGVRLVNGDTVEIDGDISISGPAGISVRLIWDTGVKPRPDALSEADSYANFWALSF